MRVPVREPVAGRDTLIAQATLLELKRLTRKTKLQVRRARKGGPDVRQILPEVPERERHGLDSTVKLHAARQDGRPAGRSSTGAQDSGSDPSGNPIEIFQPVG